MQHTWLDLKINNPTAGVDTGQCTGLNFVRTKNKVISAQKAVVCFLSEAENQPGPLGARLVPCENFSLCLSTLPFFCRDHWDHWHWLLFLSRRPLLEWVRRGENSTRRREASVMACLQAKRSFVYRSSSILGVKLAIYAEPQSLC